MIRHIVLCKFKNDEDKQKGYEMCKALAGKIDVIKDFEIGLEMSDNPRRYHMAILMNFETAADLKTYDEHPDHADVRVFLRDNCESMASIDFEH